MKDPLMGTLGLAALVIAGACSSGGGGGGGGNPPITVLGSGTLAEETRAIGSFTRVSYFTEGALHIEQAVNVASVVRVTYFTAAALRIEEHSAPAGQAPKETLLIRAEDNLLPYLLADVEGGVLQLRTGSNVDLQPTLPIEFFLTVVSLESVDFKGIGSMDVSGLTTDELAVTCTGVGSVELSDLEALELDLVVSGIGEVRASGNVDRQTVTLRGFGAYQGEDLQVREADVLVEGINSATVRVSDLLIATIRSSGSVFYIGDPTVEATITGTGTVEQIDE